MNTFNQLKKKYKTHQRVAELLGISPRQYARIRKGEFPIKKGIARLIEDLLYPNDKAA